MLFGLFLKNEFKNLTLKKITFDSNFDGFDERQTFNILHKYFVDKYNLGTSKKNNKTTLEANGYNFKNTTIYLHFCYLNFAKVLI